MTKGSCDPGVGNHNSTELDKAAGAVKLIVVWDWDGTSVYPNCDGPVVSVETVNTTTDTYYAHLPHKTKGLTAVAINPGTDTTLTGNQLRQAGLDTYSSLLDLVIDQSPT